MKLPNSTLFILLQFSVALPAQSPQSNPQPLSFHVHGTITSHESPASATPIVFQGEKTAKTVTTDAQGFYEVELPVGSYTMSVPLGQGRAHYNYLLRPLFRGTDSANLVFNSTLDAAGGTENMSVAAEDRTPFRLLVRYGDLSLGFTGTRWYHGYHALPEELHGLIFRTPMGGLVRVEYNLFTLRADRVIYHKRQKMIEAKGSVVFENGTGKDQRAETMLLRIANGTLTPVSNSLN
jgi:hypothetical protein